jgi:carbamoyl-phosphate synthase large subunit
MKKTILITSVGSLVGQNVLDSLKNRRQNLKIVGTNSIAEVANNFRCEKTYLISKTENLEIYIRELTGIIEKERPDLVIPGRDEEVVILAKLAKIIPGFENRFLAGTEYFARCMDDKVESYRFALKHNLPFAPTLQSGTPDSEIKAQSLIEKFGFPLIAKPSKGNGSRGIWIVLNKTQLEKVIKEPDFAIQPLFGQSANLTLDTSFGIPLFWEIPESRLFASQVVINKNGEIDAVIGFIAKMVNGKCERMDRSENPEMRKIVMRFAEAAVVEGWRGPFNVQLKEDPIHGFQVIEMNGRFSGGTSGRYYFGFDEVGMVLEDWIGKGVIPEKQLPRDVNVVTKILTDFEIKQSNVDTLLREKIWESQEN